MSTHEALNVRRYSLDERLFWKIHPRAAAHDGQNRIFTFQCSCGSAGSILNSPAGWRRMFTVHIDAPKDAIARVGVCLLTFSTLRAELVALQETKDDDELGLSAEQQMVLAEDFRVKLDAKRNKGVTGSST